MKKTTLLFALLMTLLTLGAAQGQGFVTTWKTDNPGTSNDDQIIIPTTGAGYNYSVDWGDGNFDTGVTGDITHTYASAGTYTVSISGDFPRIYFDFSGDRQKLLTVENWGAIAWTSFEDAFNGCANLQINATDAPDLGLVTTLKNAFRNCTVLNASLNNWDVSTVTNMEFVFYNSPAFNGDVSGWDVSNVTSMWNMFGIAESFNVDISGWNVSKVENMNSMFSRAESFNQDLSSWDVSQVTDMGMLFDRANAFNGDITTWDVSNVISLGSAFSSAGNFNQDISSWNVSKVESFNKTFNGAFSFNQDISGWDVSSASSMSRMFLSAGNFDQDISSWDVSGVTAMDFMFFNAQSFDADISGWDVSNVTNMTQMLEQSGLSKINYDKLLAGWSQLTLQSGVTFGAAGFTYCHGAAGRAILEGAPNNWIITDAGEECLPFVTTWKTDNPGTSNDNQITIPSILSGSPNYDVDWGDGNTDLGVTGPITHTYAGAGTYTVSISGDFTGFSFFNTGDKDKLLTVEQWGDIDTWRQLGFRGALNFDIVATDAPNLSSATNLGGAFRDCSNFNDDIGHWNTSTIQQMDQAFMNAAAFNQDLSGWDVSSVVNMKEMFRGAASFNQDLNTWDVSKVTNMFYMFTFATNFNGQISNWDVGMVNDMSNMFANTSFNQPIGNWNVGNVDNFTSMFSGSAFNQDIGSWDVSGPSTLNNMFRDTPFNHDISGWEVTGALGLASMFEGATDFNQDLGDWYFPNVTSISQMFDGASSFDQDLGAWNVSNVSFMFNLFDNTALSKENYDQTLIVWSQQTLQNNVELGALGVDYCLGGTARQSMIDTYNWTFTGDMEDCIIEIPDANFKAALLANTEINTVDDGEITIQEAEAFGGIIDIRNANNIADLTGIEYFTSLTQIFADGNPLVAVDFTANRSLERIQIQNALLTSVELPNPSSLFTLTLTGNQLTALDLQDQGSLINLIINSNNLSSLDLSMNGDLRLLRANDNANLTSINLRNSNNEDITEINLLNTPSLTCVSVDDRVLARTNWSDVDDINVYKFTCDAEAIVNIPDANFKAKLLAHDPVIDTNGDNEISYGEAEAFTGRISVFTSSIGDFTGLEAFYNLTELIANENSATVVDVRNNAELTMLELYNVPLNFVDLSANTKLEWLQLGGNSVFSSLDLSNNSELNRLTMSASAALTSITGTKNLVNLRFAYLENNSLESIDLSNSPLLAQVRLQNNNLSSLDLRNGANELINVFNTSNNPLLTCISVDDPIYSKENWTDVDDPEIFNFSCDPDEVVQIPDANFKAALLADTNINTVDDGEITYGEAQAFAGSVEVANMEISDLTGIEAFSSLTQLKVQENSLTSLVVEYNPDLTTLWAWDNQLTSIDLSRNTELLQLILNDNAIGSIDLSNNDKIGNLQLSNCDLASGVDLSNLQFLSLLTLMDNSFESIDLSNNTLLANLRLENTNLSSLDLSSNTGITQLRLSGAPITSLDLSGLTSLQTFYFDNSTIGEIDLQSSALVTLSIINNDILSTLNLNNGNNENIVNFNVRNTANLTCITVDDVAYAEANFTNIDEGVSFSTDCGNVATNFLTFSFAEETGASSIDAVSHTIDSEVAIGTDLSNLTPTFTISSGAAIDQASGIAQDFSAPFTYTITAENPNAVQEWIVTVEEANAAPTDIALDPTAIDENNLIDAVVGTFTTTDANSGDEHTYTLITGEGDDDNASFEISGDELIASEVFDFETKTSYTVRVQTEDNRGATYAEAFTISITDLPSALVGLNLSNTEVDENLEAGATIGTLSPSGDDLGTSFSYALVAGEGDADNASFAINGNQLVSAEAFNFEEQAEYSIRMEVSDGEGSSVAEAFTITINDVAEAPTSISLSSQEIAENNEAEDVIGTLTTEDEDTGETYTYALVAGEGDTDNASFLISEDQLLANEAFDFEVQSSYTIRIETNDGNGGTFQQQFTIDVTDSFEAPTALTLTGNFIAENNATGASIGTFSTTDEDAGETYTYSLVEGEGDDNNAAFTITGAELLAGEVFDFESIAAYSIRVETNDGNGGTFEDIFEIQVTDVNEGVVVVNPLEDQDLNQGFGLLEVGLGDVFEDADGDPLTYEIESSDIEVVTVSISNATITIAEVGNGVATVTVTASDGNGESASTEFDVTVVDPNDAPVVVNPIKDTEYDEGFGTSQISLEDVFSDPNDDDLTLTVTSSNRMVVEVEVIDNQIELTEVGLGTSTITVTAEDGKGGMVSDEFTVTVNEAEEVLNVPEQLQIQVYPNPVVNTLQIQSLDIVDVQLSDLNGRMLQKQRGTSISMDVRNLEKGVYLLTLKTGSTQLTQRILKVN